MGRLADEPSKAARVVAPGPFADVGRTCLYLHMTDDDEARFDERVRKLAKHEPVEKAE
jgi:predicted nucleotidyltransferase